MITCRALGPVELTVGGEAAPAELLWRKNLALLVYLARSPQRERTREHLVGLLWGEKPEPAARHSLTEALRVVRRYAGKGAVDARSGRVRLAPAAVLLDTDRFEACAAAGRWREAAELVGGEFLEGLGVPGASRFEDWVAGERTLWRRRSVEALVRHAEELLAVGKSREASDASHRALALDATSDLAVRVAMRSVALAGDRASALELYETFAARLVGEVGIEPDAATRALAERVRLERTWRLPAPALAAAGEGAASSRRSPLVGREADLERLLVAWAACRAERHPAAGFLDGDPGTGKTRLAEELLARARLDGAAVGAVRAVEADMREPWSGAVGLARGGLLDAPGLAAASPSALAAFAARVDAWADRFGAAVRAVTPTPLGRALSEVLRAVSEEQPTLVAVDDAQWQDDESLLALGAALRDLPRAPLLVLFATAPHPPRPQLDDLRARIGRDLRGVALRLGPLSGDALKALARWALPGYDEAEIDRVTRRVRTDSAGLPLLAVEIFHAVAQGLDLAQSRAAWPQPLRTLDESLPGDLPDAVVAAVRVGFRRLSTDAQRVLAAASVLGERVPRQALAMGAGLDGEALAAALDELEWQRWLSAEPRGYSFLARIVRDVVARDLVLPGQRHRILERAAASGR